MSGEVSAGRPLDVPSQRASLLPKWVPRSLRFAIGLPSRPGHRWPSLFDAAVDRSELEAISPAPARPVRSVQLGIVLYLVCVGAVGAVIIAVSFWVGLYSLGHSVEEPISNPWAHKHAGLAPALLGDKAPSNRADVPPLIAASLGVLTASTTNPPQLGATDTLGGQAPQPGGTASSLGASPGPRSEPAQGQGGAYSDAKRSKNASADLVTGTVIEAADAMTWVVGDYTVHLWGIRPTSRNLRPSLDRLVEAVRAKGPLRCRRQTHSTRYQCFTANGEDIAVAALGMGVGRAAGGAPVAYRGAEAEAHRQGRGVWAKS